MMTRARSSTDNQHSSWLSSLGMNPPKTRFLKALTAPFTPMVKENLEPGLSSNVMYPQSAKLVTSDEEDDHTNPLALRLWKSTGAWQWADGQPLSQTRVVFERREGSSIKTWFGVGLIGRETVQFICQTWPLQQAFGGFIAEMAFNKVQLLPLQGTHVPTIIGVYAGHGVANVITELPHHQFWISPCPDMPHILKKRCIIAFEQIHSRGVLHGNPCPEKISIGGDGRVMLLDFENAKAVEPVRDVYMKQATPEDLRMEIRHVRYMLDYENSREMEHEKWARHVQRQNHNMDQSRIADGDSDYLPDIWETPEEDIIDPPVNPRQAKWYLDSSYRPTRFVVPGTSVESFRTGIRNFMTNLERMERESEKSPSRSPSPPPRKVGHDESEKFIPEPHNQGPDGMLGKRKDPKRKNRPDDEERVAKRRRTKDNRLVGGSSTHTQALRTSATQAVAGSSTIAAPPGILKVKTVVHIHPSVLQNNANPDLPTIYVRDFPYEVTQPYEETAKLSPGVPLSPYMPPKKRIRVKHAVNVLNHLKKHGSLTILPGGNRMVPPGSPVPKRVRSGRKISFAPAPDVFLRDHKFSRPYWNGRAKKRKVKVKGRQQERLKRFGRVHGAKSAVLGTSFRTRIREPREPSKVKEEKGVSHLLAALAFDFPFTFTFPLLRTACRWLGVGLFS